MAWARLDDGFHDHPKVDGLSLAAVGLYTLCLTWAHRHRKGAILPGHITEARVRKLAGKQADTLTAELTTVGLWERESGIGGYVIHDFGDYLPKERDPSERKEAGRKGAAKRWQADGKPDGNLPSDSMASDSSRASAPAFPSRPVPSQGSSVEGERPEPLRAVPASKPPKNDADEGCTRHPDGNPNDTPCRGCQRVEERKAQRATREADRAAVLAEQAARDCVICEGTHFVLDDEKRPTTRKCRDHKASA